jgi:hypothetical protein
MAMATSHILLNQSMGFDEADGKLVLIHPAVRMR